MARTDTRDTTGTTETTDLLIEGLDAEWLWQLAAVTVPPPRSASKGKGTDHGVSPDLLHTIRIEEYEGHPLLVATDGRMMSVALATAGRAAIPAGVAGVNLSLVDELRKAVGHGGAGGRRDRTVRIAAGKHGTGSSGDLVIEVRDRIGSSRPPVIFGGDLAAQYVHPGGRYANWRSVLPSDAAIAASPARLAKWCGGSDPRPLAGIAAGMLAKVPALGTGGYVISPVVMRTPAGPDSDVPSVYVIREGVDFPRDRVTGDKLRGSLDDARTNRCVTIVMPFSPVARPALGLPAFARARSQPESAGKAANKGGSTDADTDTSD